MQKDKGRGQHRKYLPYAFTEHGALMLGNVLKSERAVEMSLMVVRAFVRMRELVAGNKELAQKLAQLERKVGAHDKAIAEIVNAIRQLMAPSEPSKKRPRQFCAVEREVMLTPFTAASVLTRQHATPNGCCTITA
jgi:hypothetical protein